MSPGRSPHSAFPEKPRGKNPLGCIALVLHTHLPYVRHPEHENFLEEIWLYEAMLETYLPLLGRLESLVDRKIPFEMAVVLSPTLLAMWEDPLLQKRFQRYASDLAALAEREILRLNDQPEFLKAGGDVPRPDPGRAGPLGEKIPERSGQGF